MRSRSELGSRTTENVTPCSTVLPEKLGGSELIKKFSAFYGNRKFIVTFTNARQLSFTLSQMISLSPTPCETLRYVVRFYDEEFLAPLPTPKLENHPLSTIRDCLYQITRSPHPRAFLTVLALTKLGMLIIAIFLTSTAV